LEGIHSLIRIADCNVFEILDVSCTVSNGRERLNDSSQFLLNPLKQENSAYSSTIEQWARELLSFVYSCDVARVTLDLRGETPMPNYSDSSKVYIGGADQSGQVMTSVEAAEYLKMHVKTVCRLAKEGKIPAKKVGSEWRFMRSVLDSWLSESLV
jgi:excisionase family DNA binding protein